MSSRALKKAQRARDRVEQERKALSSEDGESEASDSPPRGQQSGFAVLGQNVEASDGNGDDSHDENPVTQRGQDTRSTDDGESQDDEPQAPAKAPTRRRKKKKKKGKSPGNQPSSRKGKSNEPDLDEIDKALRELSLQEKVQDTRSDHPASQVDPSMQELCKLLAIDLQHLQVSNEMRRLFGKAALQVDNENDGQSAPAQPTPHGARITIAEAVTGRNSQGGAGLPAMIRRRNIFMQGKEVWPKASGGGLKMEVLEEREGGIKQFTFVHNEEYQRSQREFDAVVRSMDPGLMVNLLVFIPYHISTLLQVSEIAKQDRDHVTCGDLLERALFSFGRAAHPSFSSSLKEGKARLDFTRPENREFWLAAWRYVGNISMRATWRTAYEWAKLLLSLDPESDPYRMCMVIDQFALRSRQYKNFLGLFHNAYLNWSTRPDWRILPNINFSLGLAFKGLMPSLHENATQLVCRAIERHPWVAARLFQELGIERMPPSIWGKEAPNDTEKLRSEHYVMQALDLWKTPEATEFLKQAAKDVHRKKDVMVPENHHNSPISIDESRHVILLDKPALISLLDPEVVSLVSSSSDPLPPKNNHVSYSTGVGEGVRYREPRDIRGDEEAVDFLINTQPANFMRQLRDLQDSFEALLTVRGVTVQPTPEPSQHGRSASSAAQAVTEAEAAGHPMASRLRWASSRIRIYHDTLSRRPERELRTDHGSVAALDEDGVARVNLVAEDDDDQEWRNPGFFSEDDSESEETDS